MKTGFVRGFAVALIWSACAYQMLMFFSPVHSWFSDRVGFLAGGATVLASVPLVFVTPFYYAFHDGLWMPLIVLVIGLGVPMVLFVVMPADPRDEKMAARKP